VLWALPRENVRWMGTAPGEAVLASEAPGF